MIELSKTDKQWINFCKGNHDYPTANTWTDSLKPLFTEIYGWNPDEDNNYHDYLNCIFNKLLDVHLKILVDHSGCNRQIRDVFGAAFYKGISNSQELPIERSIAELCGLIQCNIVVDNGVKRYEL